VIDHTDREQNSVYFGEMVTNNLNHYF